MIKGPTTVRLIAALALALVLSLQSIVSAFALDVQSSAPQLDAFGNPLCLNGPGHSGSDGSDVPDHSKLPSCCTLACSMFWLGVPAPADASSIALRPRVPIHFAFIAREAPQRAAPGYEPGNPRAPPLTI